MSHIDELVKIAGKESICTNQAELMCYAYESSRD